MCLARRVRVATGDSRGDWCAAPPVARAGRSPRRRKGRRARVDSAAVAALRDGDGGSSCSEVEAAPWEGASMAPRAVVLLGEFLPPLFEDLPARDEQGCSPPGSVLRVRPSAVVPQGRGGLLDLAAFPPLPPSPRRLGSPCSRSGDQGPSELLVGTVVVPLGAALGSPPPPSSPLACVGADAGQLGFPSPGPQVGRDVVGSVGGEAVAQSWASVVRGLRVSSECLSVASASLLSGPLGAQPTSVAQSEDAGAPPLLKWLWLPVGTLDLALGFPAPPRDVRRHHKRAKRLPSQPASPAASPPSDLVAMDRDRGGPDRRGKRSYDDFSRDGGHHRGGDLRYRLIRDQEEARRREREREVEEDRREAARREDARREEERLRAQIRIPPRCEGAMLGGVKEADRQEARRRRGGSVGGR